MPAPKTPRTAVATADAPPSAPAPTEASALEVSPEPSAEQRKRDNRVISLPLVAAFTVILNETVMGVAIPHLMGTWGSRPSRRNGSRRRSS
jgi:hypothetical protein